MNTQLRHHHSSGLLFATLMLCAMAVAGCAGRHEEQERSQSMADSLHGTEPALRPPVTTHASTASYEERQGAILFSKYCAVCHGLEGKGDGFNAFNLDPRPRDLSDSTYMSALSDAQLVQTISGGGRSVNKSPLMPAYGWTLGRQQIQELASFVKSLPN